MRTTAGSWRRRRRLAVMVPLMAVAAMLPGCFSLGGEGAPEIRRHALDLPVVAHDATTEPEFPSIVLRELTARGRYETRVLVQDAPGRVAYLELDRWVEEPAEAVTTVLRETMASSGRFEAVSAATSDVETDLVLDGTLLAFDVIRPSDGPWRVRLAVRLEVAERTSGALVHAAAFRVERPLPGASTAGLGAAMGACATTIAEEAMDAWAAASSARQ